MMRLVPTMMLMWLKMVNQTKENTNTKRERTKKIYN
jgi:hypothetical protein